MFRRIAPIRAFYPRTLVRVAEAVMINSGKFTIYKGGVMSDLETKLNELLAKEFGVAPDEVDCGLIDRWRSEHPFPPEKYETRSLTGGYNVKKVLSEEELREMHERANAFLDKYSDAAKT